MSKHTPGPWRYYTEPQPNGCPIVGTCRGLMVAMLAHSVKEKGQEIEAIANARLIAAAPDLLEALSLLLLETEDYPELMPQTLRQARAAIAKATK